MQAIPEMEVLIEEIDALYVEHAGAQSGAKTLSRGEVQARLTSWSAALLASLPAFIQEEVRDCRSWTRISISALGESTLSVSPAYAQVRERHGTRTRQVGECGLALLC